MRLSPLYLTSLFELCLLGLASFLRPLLFWDFFGDFIPKGENVEPKQCVNIGREDQNGGSLI
jgi:hypothetical protein